MPSATAAKRVADRERELETVVSLCTVVAVWDGVPRDAFPPRFIFNLDLPAAHYQCLLPLTSSQRSFFSCLAAAGTSSNQVTDTNLTPSKRGAVSTGRQVWGIFFLLC